MRRNGAGHAHRNPFRTIRKQVREARGHDDWLLLGAVIGGPKIDGIRIHILHEENGRIRQLRFGVTHGGGVITINAAEVPLTIDQRIAHAERLRQAHHGIIHSRIAMRVIFTDHIPDHTGTFFIARGRVELELHHGIEQAAMDGLQAIPHIRQRASGNGRKRIGQIALAQGILERDGLNRRYFNGWGFGHRAAKLADALANARGSVFGIQGKEAALHDSILTTTI